MAKGKLSNSLVWILLGLLIVALAGFSAGGFGVNVRSIGKVGDQDIPAAAYANTLQQEIRALSQQTQQNITFEQALGFGLDGQVLEQVIAVTALDNEVSQMGLSVGDEVVRQTILNTPAFRGLDGEFDRVSYSEVMRNSGVDEREYEASVRRDTARALLVNAVSRGTTASESYINTLYEFLASRRNFAWTTVTSASAGASESTPTDADLLAYYTENPELFSLPERKSLAYVWVTPDMLMDEIDVDEDTLRGLYEERSEVYQRPARRLLERLVIPSVEEADAASARLTSGDVTFEALVEERGLSLDDVNMGTVTERDLEAGAEVFALEEPGLTGVLPSSLGPAIFRVNAILVEQITPFEEARDSLATSIRQDRAARQIEDRAGDYDDLLAGGATLEEVAQDGFLQYGTLEYYPGVEPGVDDGILAYQAFQQTASLTNEGDFAEIRQLEDGGLFAVEFLETLPEVLQPIEDVRDQVDQAWRDAEAIEVVMMAASELAEAWRQGDVPGNAGYSLTNEVDVVRSSSIPDTPPSFVTDVFEMEPEEVRVIEFGDQAIVVRLTATLEPDPDNAELVAIRDTLELSTTQDLSQDIIALFTQSVQTTSRIQLDQGAIAAIHNGFLSPHGGGY